MDKAKFQEMKDEKKKIVKDFMERMKSEGKQFFAEASKTLFEENPELESFGWTQYTPYFNDGDTCTFSASLQYPFVQMVGEEFDDEESWFKADDESLPAVTHRNVVEFLSQFDDEDVEILFGDHAKVIVTREGVEVEEYEHD